MVITLCGSARFEKEFHDWNLALTLSGHIVFALTSYPSLNKGIKEWYDKETKERLDLAHFMKISKSEAILVLNRWAYIGESTKKEILCAEFLNKEIYCLESWGQKCGIGSNHYKSVQDAAKAATEKDFYGSPIDTTRYRHAYDLLITSDFNLRHRLIELLRHDPDF